MQPSYRLQRLARARPVQTQVTSNYQVIHRCLLCQVLQHRFQSDLIAMYIRYNRNSHMLSLRETGRIKLLILYPTRRVETRLLHRIGVISDTHIPHFKQLPAVTWKHFAGVELIIHAGDLSILAVISELETIAPVVAVQGNIEQEEVVLKLPIKREIVIGGCRIGIVHILGDAKSHARVARQEFPRARVVVERSRRRIVSDCA